MSLRPKTPEDDNVFELDWRENPLQSKMVDIRLKKILQSARKKIKKLDEKYPDAGIGDTNTDEAIASYLYELIHYY